MVLEAGNASGVEDQRAEGEGCYENDKDERGNAIHTPHLRNVCLNIREVERIGKSDTGRVDRQHFAA